VDPGTSEPGAPTPLPHYGLLHCYVDLLLRQYLKLWLSTLPPSCPFDSYQFVDVMDYIRHLNDSHFYTSIEVEVGEMVHWKAGLAEYKCPHCVMKFPVRTLESGERDLGELVEHCGLLHNFSPYYLQQGYPPAGVKLKVKQEEEELEQPLVWYGTSVMQGDVQVLVTAMSPNHQASLVTSPPTQARELLGRLKEKKEEKEERIEHGDTRATDALGAGMAWHGTAWHGMAWPAGRQHGQRGYGQHSQYEVMIGTQANQCNKMLPVKKKINI